MNPIPTPLTSPRQPLGSDAASMPVSGAYSTGAGPGAPVNPRQPVVSGAAGGFCRTDSAQAKMLRRRSRLASKRASIEAEIVAESLRIYGLLHEIHRDTRGAKR